MRPRRKQRPDHLARPFDRNRFVRITVKCPDGDVFGPRCAQFVATTANRNRSSPTLRRTANVIPCPVTTHRKASHVKSIRIDVEIFRQSLEGREEQLRWSARFHRQRTSTSPIN